MLRRFIADEVSGDRAALRGAHADHLTRVLRARVGQEFDIVADDRVRRGRISHIEDERVEFELGEEVPEHAHSPVELWLAIFKFDRMEWAIEKCTELGTARIVPLIAERTDAHLAQAATKRLERWRRLALQAAEQSRRDSVPEIANPIKLTAPGLIAGEGTRIVLSETERGLTLKEALAARQPESAVVLAIGPEGGWTEDELRRFQDAGWQSTSLGQTILRAETAAIAALAVVMSELL